MGNILRVYLENSVVGGYFDEEFETPTKKLFEELKKETIHQLYLLMLWLN